MDQRVRPPCNSSEEIITKAQIINRFELFEKNTIGNSGNRTEVQKQHGRKVVEDFVKAQKGKAILAFTDGSVVNGPYGAGGCAVSIIPKDDLESTIKRGKPVGMNVDNVDCELGPSRKYVRSEGEGGGSSKSVRKRTRGRGGQCPSVRTL